MKLLDLLKSLNNGPAFNPDNAAALNPDDTKAFNSDIDAAAPLNTPTAATTDNRKRLLTELNSIAELLDAPNATPEPTPPAAVTSDTKNLLDIEHIFGDSDGLNAPEELIVGDTQVMPLIFMPAENTAETLTNRKQIIESLLAELLPIFKNGLTERLNQLDNSTLQQWQQILLDTAELQNAASK
jgi:hypothetical protein